MALDTAISLTTVAEVLAYMGIAPERDAFWAYFTGTSGTNTIQINDNSVVLIDVDNVSTTFDITVATGTYDTLTKLVNGINGIAGWECGLIYVGDALSVDLIITGALDAEGLANRQTLLILDVWLIEQLINRASDLLNRYCERTLKTTGYTLERYNGEAEKLFLYNYPVTDVVQVCDGIIDAIRVRCTLTTAYNAYVEVIRGATVKLIRDGTEDADIDTTLAANDTLGELAVVINAVANWEGAIANSLFNPYPSSQLFTKYNYACNNQNTYLEIPDDPINDYDMDYEKGIIYLPSRFSRGFQNIYVSHTAGYVTIPYILEQACIQLVKFKWDMSQKDSGIESEQIGTVYRYKLKNIQDALSADIIAEIDLFRSRNL